MFNEGAPKESHKLVVAVGVAAGLAMFFSSFDAGVLYRTQEGREIFINDGAEWSRLTGLIIVGLLIAWHRGALNGAWPLFFSLIGAVLVVLMSAGDWYLGVTTARDGDLSINATFYAVVLAGVVAAIACVIALNRPAVERSGSVGEWQLPHPPDRR